ncbi:anthranilate phosphoribosyltransferase [Fusibacter paucivorans]|uniref:Anthranilate phosphoribosyltransferase n=1 Tax=Fusibacter paucivorans TaxID=76009 RepID=A0ABS5PKM9_9FIRM|nr:anthranilate phosphoribosyltransferase [Fusibacter paucivorans]MBS7525728.1 anthranilate phosphoribosyltransferase [Fusibacter paucivorans]
MYLLIDNYDSFTYNLSDMLRRLKCEVEIRYNDQIDVEEIQAGNYEAIIISPGPSHPKNAGNIIKIIQNFYNKMPILGICLGHQAIGAAMAMEVNRCPKIMHGKVDRIRHIDDQIFKDIPDDFEAVRYHSLVIDHKASSDVLTPIAHASSDGEIMAISHVDYPVYGFQFHPESYETKVGEQLMMNFIEITERYNIEKSSEAEIQESRQKAISEAAMLADDVLNFRMPKATIVEYLEKMSNRGETTAEIAGFAKAMKANALKLSGHYHQLGDTCGTGGDGLHTYNISTGCAFVLAAAGIPIAKHGNRSVSSLCGSADVLEALGANIALTPNQANDVLRDAGIVFLFAQKFHPKMKDIMPIRKAISGPTVFNIVGPLSNPAPLTHQVIGVYREDLMAPMLESMKDLGVNACATIYGCGGMDELSLAGENKVLLYRDGKMQSMTLDPKAYGFPIVDNEAIRGGDAEHNATALKAAFQGQHDALESVITLNAGFALYVFENVPSLEAGFEKASKIIRTGVALSTMNRYITASQAVAHEYPQ